jgi:SAM-dependent methyltransferase
MYKELRPVAAAESTASTPEIWAENFAASLSGALERSAKCESTPEWSIVRRVMPPGGRILDAGCGAGEWVLFLNRHGYEAIGVDYSRELVDCLKQLHPGSTWHQADIRALTAIPDGHVDGVISWGVIEHDEAGPAAALREFHRITKPGGTIVVTVPRDSAQQRKCSRLHFPESDSEAFFQCFMTEEELAGHVRAAGFEVTDSNSLRHGSLALFAPAFHKRARGLVFRIANKAARVLLAPFARYRGMNYCVGRKTLARDERHAAQRDR